MAKQNKSEKQNPKPKQSPKTDGNSEQGNFSKHTRKTITSDRPPTKPNKK